MFEFELDRKKAELRCQNATRIADELESHSSSALMRSPDNPYLTRAVAYNLYLSASRDRPILVNPHEFAIQLLFVHRGLYGGVEAALDYSDPILLGDGLGMSATEVRAVRDCWVQLRDRRKNRKHAPKARAQAEVVTP